MFIHLRTHSHYSLLEGLSSPKEIAEAAARLEMPALGLTDRGRLSGAIEFYEACRDLGVKPLIGLELDVIPPTILGSPVQQKTGQLALLVENLAGWGNLCRLASAAQIDPGGITPIPFDILAENSAGLICLTGGERGLLQGWEQAGSGKFLIDQLEILKDIYPDRLYVELQGQSPGAGKKLVHLVNAANKAKLPYVATRSIYYLTPEQKSLQRTLAAIRLNRTLDLVEAQDFAPPEAHFGTPAEITLVFKAYPQALESTREIAERCRLELPLGTPHFPGIELPDGTTPTEALRQKAVEGAKKIYGEEASIIHRLGHELRVIEQCGYESLFLVMQEIVDFAHQSGIPIAARGSASSSLVAHCLGITSPDPVRLNLYFERFLNPARSTPPDIDADLCSRRRDEVIRFVYDRFGADRVAMVCTVNRFRRRSALREVAKAYGFAPARVSELADSLPPYWYGPPDRFTSQEAPYAELETRFNSADYQAVFRQAGKLIGLPRHLSIHPGGIVISPGKLTDLSPTQMANKGVLITQFDLDSIEKLGLVKIDLLGIRGLTVLGDVAQALVHPDDKLAQSPQIARRTGPASLAARGSALLEVIPEIDALTSETVEQGRTIGCFQIESPGMRATLKEVRARSVDDIMAALALYRPGPLTGGLKDAFVARFRGEQPASFLHPALIPLLEETYGVILYQEQVLRIAHELAGLSLAEADLLRRAMSHFDPGKQMETLKERFILHANQRSAVPVEIGGQIWELMAAFAGYGFPKAHAASYARVAWQSAWCKTHHSAIFLAAVLANWGGYYRQSVYLTEARRMGLALQPPAVNYALPEFSVRYLEDQPVLFMGLNQVRELTRRTQARILRNRPFHSMQDFLARADPRSQEALNLARSGALDSFGRIPALLSQIERGGWRGGQLPLFDFPGELSADWSLQEKARAQKEILGVSVIAHDLELSAAQISSSGALTTLEAASRIGQRVQVAGVRQFWRRFPSASGGFFYLMALEDLDGMLDVLIPGEVYRRNRAAFSTSGPYIIEGTVELNQEQGEPFIRAERAWVVNGE